MAKVLIADDHTEIRRLWAVNLEARHYVVVEASDGYECLRLIEEEDPDVILLDLGMPVLSGWAVLGALRDKSVQTSAPVIVVTGWTDEDVQEKARDLGAAAALIKPFGVGQLLDAIEVALSGSGR